MNSNEVEIKGEYAVLFEAQEGADVEALYEFLSQSVGKFGFKLKAQGTEKTIRLMLIDRADFIAGNTSNKD